MTKASKLKQAGILIPQVAIEEAALTGLELAVLCAVLERETGGGANVVGHDRDSAGNLIFPARPGRVPVTKALYLAYKKKRRKDGSGGMQGFGPMQLTWWELQDRADRMGGCWVPRINVRAGAEALKGEISARGLREGLKAYNGSYEYADAILARLAHWRQVCA